MSAMKEYLIDQIDKLSILGYYGLPVPGFIPKNDPGMIKLEDFFK